MNIYWNNPGPQNSKLNLIIPLHFYNIINKYCNIIYQPRKYHLRAK